MAFSKNAKAFLIDELLKSPTDDNAVAEDPQASLATAPDIRCDLTRPELWQQFATVGTEMIITKAGRRMFPCFGVQFSGEGINPNSNFLVVFEIIPASGKRFRYSYLQSSWTALDPAAASTSTAGLKRGNYFSRRANTTELGREFEMSGNKLYVHPECPIDGRRLVDKVISFERIKLTNNENLNRFSDHVEQPSKIADGQSLFGVDKAANTVWTFNFPEARFMGVTAYQNQLITKLKIDNNPFAKGFRKISRYSIAQVHLAIGAAISATAGATLAAAAAATTSQQQQQSQEIRLNKNTTKRLQNNRAGRRIANLKK